ncbi:MAG: MBL fold metallo-hydrolase [Clostridia bacterium]|nr:MBL fold metallo-hydrolase [Clostridia bacterium]
MLPYPFRIISLFSGSKGNCTFVRWGDTRILIDAGMSCRAIERSLAAVGETADDVNAIFITHEHSDHTKALPVFLKKHPVPVHITEPTAKALSHDGCPTDCFAVHTDTYSIRAAKDRNSPVIGVTAFRVPHDSRACVGYRFSFEGEDGSILRTAAISTDMGCVTDEIREALTGVRDVIIESNHDENMLLMGPYPYDLKRRILSDRGHLSNCNAAAFVCDLVAAGTKNVLLGHLSPENNTPELAYLTVQAALKQRGYVQDTDFTLGVTRRDGAVTLLDTLSSDVQSTDTGGIISC